MPLLWIALSVSVLTPSAGLAQSVPLLQTSAVAPTLIQEANLWPHLRLQLRATGTRLTVGGKERMALTGRIVRGLGAARVLVVYRDIGGRTRLEDQSDGSQRVSGYDGRSLWAQSGRLSDVDRDLIETLAFDSAERFFHTQAYGAPTRFIGSRMRGDDGKDPTYRGPYYDVYQVLDTIPDGVTGVKRMKFYCLNWETQLLERVQYTLNQPGRRVHVETVLTDWKLLDGQRIPTKVTRLEGGRATYVVEIQQAGFSAHVSDGLFAGPATR